MSIRKQIVYPSISESLRGLRVEKPLDDFLFCLKCSVGFN